MSAAVLLVLFLGSWLWVESSLNKVPALSGAANTPGETYLIVGSDSREGWADDGTEGARTDTILVLHKPQSGPAALISIPRDSLAEIPGYSPNKINAAFAFGGAPLLVNTVEQLTGLTVDHYIEVGFGGVEGIVDAVGGVELCHDTDVNDPYSGMVWTAGCHEVDGATALAFSRMRYEDPLGDIGRTLRQRQVVGAVSDKVLNPGTFFNPVRAFSVTNAGLDAITVSDGTSVLDLVGLVRSFRAATGEGGITGTPPIASIDYRVEGAGSTVLLDPDTSPAFWAAIANGDYAPGTVVGGLGR
jgi:LCP family protein required for cell wall assembly